MADKPVGAFSASVPTEEDIERAYIWGLPVVATYRRTVGWGTEKDAINQLFHLRKPIEPGEGGKTPNRDTLYSYGWFDLADEPYVLSFPSFSERYFSVQLTSIYAHNFANIGNHLREGAVKAREVGARVVGELRAVVGAGPV